jgi:Na+/H+ antiporter NhaC
MDADTKTRLKWKFFRITVQLNIIILLVALIIIASVFTQIPYRFPLIIIMLVLVLVLSVRFSREYKATKAWLDVQSDKGKDP